MEDLKNAPAQETKLHFLDYWRVIRIRKAIIITVFLITSIIATAVTFVLPESYSSMARIKVENDVTDIPGMTGVSGYVPYDPYFIQTTFEIMQSELVLSNVIAQLNLNTKWGQKYYNGETLKTTETMELLKRSMLLAPVKNTKLISITVFSDDKNEAAAIANAVAQSYRDYRFDTRRSFATNGLAALEDNFATLAHDVQTNADYVEALRNQLHIIDENPNSLEAESTLDTKQLQQINEQRITDQRTYEERMAELNRLRDIQETNISELADVLPLIVTDPDLNGLLDRYHEARQKFVTLTNDMALSSVDVLRVQSLITELTNSIASRVVGIMESLKVQVEAKKADLLSLSNSIETAKLNDQQQAQTNQPYYEAKRDLAQKVEMRRMLYAKLESEKVDLNLPQNSMVQITDWAVPGKAPVKPNKALNIILGLIFGLVMGVGLAFFIEYLDTSVKTIDDVERTFQAPVLGVIPQNIGYLLEEGTESKHAEAYRVLRTNLLFSRKHDKMNTIVVVSAGAGEGKSTTTINLATVFAQTGNRVLIVDSDLRRPTLHKLFKVSNNLGLTNYLLKQNTIPELIQTTPVPNLDFMASGRLPNSSMGILGSAQMKEMIADLRQRYDFILFDSPPILGVSDASVLASEVDLVMQVIQYRRYPQPMTIRAKQMIEKVGGNFVGLVLNNINMSQDEGYYYYSGYYHDYYYSRSAAEQDAEAKAEGGEKKAADEAAPEKKSETNIKQKY